MIVVDTGVLYAVADSDDPDHEASDHLLALHPADELLVPTTVMTEAAWMIETRLGPVSEAAFLRAVHQGELTRVELIDADLARIVELIDRYTDLGLGIVDASVVAIAERLGVITIATLDHRDFAVVRPTHCDAFELVP